MRYQAMRGRTCWLCGRNGNGDPLDKHHIFGGANRKLSEEYGQELAMEQNGWSIEEFRAVFGKSYLPLDWKPGEEEGFFMIEEDEIA